MARVCEACGKSTATGNIVTFSHRAIRRTWVPNLRRVRIYDEKGTPKRAYVCTRCLRSGKVNRTRPVAESDPSASFEDGSVSENTAEAVEVSEVATEA